MQSPLYVFQPAKIYAAVLCCTLCVLPCFAVFAGEAAPEETVAATGPWLTLEEGTRPAYVGIQGGTAPISLMQSPDGAVHSLTGNTGNDFAQILRNPTGGNATSKKAPSVGGGSQAPSAPVGLSNPEGILFLGRAGQGQPGDGSGTAGIKPLRLGSYHRVLARAGNI